MQFPSADEDEGDFTLTTAARSRLSSLFQSDGTSSGDVNQALTFQAPKQPKKNDNSQSSSGTFKLIHAATVHAYKLVDGNYANQGKLGCAILGIHENSSYKFLLYKGKQVQVTTCNIVPTFKFHVQPNNYVNFYDEKNENWSLNFDNETVLIEFAKQIAVAKANSEGKSPSKLVVQDLTVGEGPSLETGHSAEVKYTGWLLTNYTFGQIFDSNMKSESAFRLRLGKSKVIKGWHEGLIGARKGNRRLLVVPPSLAYGAEGMGATITPNSTLIFDILVTKAKVSRESSHSPIPLKLPENSPDKRPEVLPRSTSVSQEDNIRMRGASISEQLTQSPKKDKAQLISRMAKMGTAMLPLQGAVPAQVSSESENEEVPPEEPQPSRSSTASPKPLSKPSSRHNSVSSAVVQPVQPQPMLESIPLQVNQTSSQIPIYSQASLPAQQPFVPQSIAYPSYPNQLPSPYHVPHSQYQIPGMMPASSFADTHLPMLVTETRSQNTEVRLSLSKITDKVDTVIQKVDELRLQGRSSAFGSAAFMDSALLVQNIERIVQENHQLKEDAEAKNTKIQSLNEKICDLLQRNQGFFEESNSMLEQRSDSIQAVSSQSQAKLLNLEKEKANLLSELSVATSKMSTMENELTQLQSQENQLKLRLQEYEKSQNQSDESNVENESLVNSLQEHTKNLKEENSILKEKLGELENKLEELSKCNRTLTKRSEESELKIQEIESKSAMQLKELKESLNADVSSTTSEIQTLKAENERLSVEKDKLLSEAETLKTKYEVFYEKTLKMKTRYDSQIAQLMSEIQKLQSAGSSAPSSDFSGEIKKVMNILYKLLQGKFESDSSYTGTRVLEMTLETIRGLTFQMLQMKSRASSNSSEPDVETKKEPASGDSDANESSSKDPISSLDNSNKEGGAPEATNQQNGFPEENDQSEVAANDISVEPESNKGADQSAAIGQEEISTNKIDSENQVEESAIEGNSVSNTSDASSRVPDCNITEKTKDTPTDSKDANEIQSEKRASPEVNLVSELTITKSKMSAMESELTQLQSQKYHLKLKLQEYEKSENQSKESNVENESLVNSLQEHTKNLKEENSILKEKLGELENKLEELSKCNATLTRAVVSSINRQIQTLRTENERLSVEKDKLLSEAETLKTKYEVFYEKTLKMKARYDGQIAQLMTEIQKLQSAGSSAPSSHFSGEIKNAMNILYKLLQGKFESDSSYTGTRVLEMTLETIRGLTFLMLQMKSRASSNSSEPDVESKKEPALGDSNANQSSSKGLISLLDNNNKEGGAPEVTNQQNGFLEENDQSEVVASNDISVESESNKGADQSTAIGQEEFSTNKIDSDNKVEESAIEGDSVTNSSDASSTVLDSNITEGTKDTPPTISKDANEIQSKKRASPEHLPSTADVPLPGNKV